MGQIIRSAHPRLLVSAESSLVLTRTGSARGAPVAGAIGHPQCGHAGAASETSLLQSGHLIKPTGAPFLPNEFQVVPVARRPGR